VTFTITLATADEYDEVGALTTGAYEMDGLVPAGSGYEAVLRDAAGRAEKAELWVARDGDELLGTVTFCPLGSPYREISTDREGEFRMLAVAPAARGLGVGELLTRHCVERTRELGLDAVVLSSSSAMAAAHRLYTRLGFVRLPARDWSPVAGVELLAFTLDL
jgi:ribosomal protein S18 acetylase RimI-like enzyme